MIRSWLERLVDLVEIDWTGFARTHGCFVVGHVIVDERSIRTPVTFPSRWESWVDGFVLPRFMDSPGGT